MESVEQENSMESVEQENSMNKDWDCARLGFRI